MAKAIPQKKKRPKFSKRPVPGKKGQISKPKVDATVQWIAIGIDTSTYSISGAAIALQHGQLSKARTHAIRWEKGTDYFTRMRGAAKASDFIHDLVGPLLGASCEQVFIAIEEAVSFGHLQRMQSQSVKQQLQISGSMMGGLLRWGWENIYEIQANQWRKIVADDLGITITKQKYGNAEFLPLPDGYLVQPQAVGKFRSKQWVQQFHPEWDEGWPDLIKHNKLGVIEKPVTSKAKSFQPDDKYDALAMMEWMKRELERREA